jgi:hypothetical protein
MGVLEVEVLGACNLPHKLLGNPSPYVVIRVETHSWATAAAMHTVNPRWNAITRFGIMNTCAAIVHFDVWHKSHLKDKLMGTCSTSVSGLRKGARRSQVLRIRNPKSGYAELMIALRAVDFGIVPSAIGCVSTPVSVTRTTVTTNSAFNAPLVSSPLGTPLRSPLMSVRSPVFRSPLAVRSAVQQPQIMATPRMTTWVNPPVAYTPRAGSPLLAYSNVQRLSFPSTPAPSYPSRPFSAPMAMMGQFSPAVTPSGSMIARTVPSSVIRNTAPPLAPGASCGAGAMCINAGCGIQQQHQHQQQQQLHQALLYPPTSILNTPINIDLPSMRASTLQQQQTTTTTTNSSFGQVPQQFSHTQRYPVLQEMVPSNGMMNFVPPSPNNRQVFVPAPNAAVHPQLIPRAQQQQQEIVQTNVQERYPDGTTVNHQQQDIHRQSQIQAV